MTNERRLHLHVHAEEALTRLEVQGEVDAHSAAELDAALDEIALTGATHVLVDLGGVDFMDSTGMRVLVAAHKMMDVRDGSLTLANVTPSVARALTYAGLLEHLTVQEA